MFTGVIILVYATEAEHRCNNMVVEQYLAADRACEMKMALFEIHEAEVSSNSHI